MYINIEELSEEQKEQIEELSRWCKQHNQLVIPQLLKNALSSSGIREDVLQFFGENREMDINRDLCIAFERLLASRQAESGWYELLLRLNQEKDAAFAGELMDETLSAFRAEIPLELASRVLECQAADEFIRLRRMYEQEELRDKMYSLEGDVDYFKQLYKASHSELDQISLELARIRRENKQLEQKIQQQENYADSRVLEEKDIPLVNIHMITAEPVETERPFNDYSRSEMVYSEEEPVYEPLPAIMAESYDDMEFPEAPASESLQLQEMDVFDKDTTAKNWKTVSIFTGLVKKVRTMRFRRSTELEQRREIVSTMTRNEFESDRQQLVLTALKGGHIPWEYIYSYVYDNASAEELEDILIKPETNE